MDLNIFRTNIHLNSVNQPYKIDLTSMQHKIHDRVYSMQCSELEKNAKFISVLDVAFSLNSISLK